MPASKSLLTFMHRLACRHLYASGSIATALKELSEGKKASKITYAYAADNKKRFTANLLSVLGQGAAEGRADALTEAIAAAIESEADHDKEANLILADALEVLSAEEETRQEFSIDALQEQLLQSTVQFKDAGGFKQATFTGMAAYPAQIKNAEGTWRLVSASYRKGVYQLERKHATK
jgi:hypothetical protein